MRALHRDGVCSALPTLERRTDGSASSLWPTAKATDGSKGGPNQTGGTLPEMVWKEARATWPTPDASVMNDGETVASFMARRELLKQKHINGNGAGIPLAIAAKMWPTATVNGNHNRKGASPTSGDGLDTSVKMWLTPSANEDAAGTPRGDMQKMLGNDPVIRGDTPDQWDNGVLNPDWVEQLMGWPTGWTGLPPETFGRKVAVRRSTRGKRLGSARQSTPSGSAG